MRYSDEIIEEVRSRNDIVDVIGQYVSLKRAGANYVGLCPFHNEKSPSFSVSPGKQMFYCFGCRVGGNVFSFLMKYDNLTFGEAMKTLAERAGVKLPEEDESPEAKRMRDKRQTLLEINKEAAKYYVYQLKSPAGEKGLKYFKDRALSDETIKKFGLGYSNVTSDDLVKYLKSKGYSDSQIIDAGLASHDEKYGTHDKFWNRVMFPILDANSKVIGFGGRVMGDGKPKYLNSPETMIFDKSRNLFGLNYAKNARAGYIIICEGYMDVIAMHQAGFNMAVASLGTAFTSQQASLLKRYTDLVILSYDSDGAGTSAALRGIEILKGAGLKGKVLNLKPYKDPDEFIKNEGREAFEERIKKAENPFFFEIAVKEKEFDMSDPAEKTEFHRYIGKKLCEFTEAVERENYLEAVAQRYMISADDLHKLVAGLAAEGGIVKSSERPKTPKQYNTPKEDPSRKPQRLLITWLADEPEVFSAVKKWIGPKDFADEMYRSIADEMWKGLDDGSFDPAKVMNHFTDEEEQREVAELFNTNLVKVDTKDEREKAMHDILYDIKKSGYEKTLSDMEADAPERWNYTLEGKRMLEELSRTKIVLKA
ncbi:MULTISPECIES: DNA primase [unclassified Butyrivibrio]|uniref:DNA primase n=1 Tax=unclassified Butyrivibrio TaxID=2639466 RepID=UPI0003B3D4A1|nr:MULTISPECIES: DNA primase [unclassified Butyrivibrio]SDB32930.1 DNA primase [Butyrivibrio sp. INlla16]